MGKRCFRIPEVLTPEEQRALLRQPNRRYPAGQRSTTEVSSLMAKRRKVDIRHL